MSLTFLSMVSSFLPSWLLLRNKKNYDVILTVGLMRMMEVATKTPNVADVIGSIAWKVQAKGVSYKLLLYQAVNV